MLNYTAKYDRYVSHDGRVYRKNTDGDLVPCKLNTSRKDGYITSFANGKNILVHRMVAEAFGLFKSNEATELDHIDGNRANNCVTNLRWVTHQENLNNPVTTKRKSDCMIGRQNLLGYRFSAESKKRMSESRKGTGNAFYGKSHTDDAKRKNAEAHRGKHRVYREDGSFYMA